MTKSNLAEVIEFKPPEFKAGDIARANKNYGTFVTKGHYYAVMGQSWTWTDPEQVIHIESDAGKMCVARARYFVRIDPQHAPEGFKEHV